MLLIFDLDGTLVDSKDCIVHSVQHAFTSHCLAVPSADQIVQAMGIPIEVTFPEWSGLADVDALMADYRSEFARRSETELKLFPRLEYVLPKLAEKATLAIATSKKRAVAEHSLEVCGIRQYFSMIVGADDVQNYKPHPESIHKILAAFPGETEGGVWMIGDATSDIEMGEAVNVCTCAVTWGAHSIDALSDLYPTSILHNPMEFLWLFGEHSCGSFMEEMVIRPWQPADSIEEITNLLHAAYKAVDQGMIYNASHQPPSQTQLRLQWGHPFVVIDDPMRELPKTIGTITLYASDPNSEHPFYRRPGMMYFGQFAVDPAFQGYGLGRKMYDHVESFARELGATEIALDTSEHAHDLIAMYRKWGFEIVDEADWDSTNYKSVVMSKTLI